jgi:L-aminopeptidase/D-esterase-like protein
MTLSNVPGIRVGHAEVPGGGSGCTVVLGPFRAAVEVRGMATGTRELEVLSPYHLVSQVNAILLAGGSAFGLSAADGVMDWLKERGEGFDAGVATVPLVPAAVIFDLKPGVGTPGPSEGRRAAEAATGGPVPEGRIGAGAGATVGKLAGLSAALPGGIGSASRSWGGGIVGALVVVNALGDIVASDGTLVAGAGQPEDLPDFGDDSAVGEGSPFSGWPGTNTTLAVVATDLPLSKVELGKLARIASTAFPRAITPVHTPFDGDLLFALSTGAEDGPIPPDRLLGLGVVARELTEEAIRRAVTQGPGQRGASGSGGAPGS